MSDFPKIELHVHLEGTVRPDTLRAIAKRNDYALPDDLESLYRYRDFEHFIEVFVLTLRALQRYDDFREIVVAYAAEAKAHGAVYLEGIFTPQLLNGLDTDEVFSGYCDGAAEAKERHGVEVRLTPDIPRDDYTLEQALTTARYAVKYRDRGVVGARTRRRRARPSARAVRAGVRPRARGRARVGPARRRGGRRRVGARRARRACAPTGSATGSAPSRIRGSSAELAGRGTVLDVCPLSNLRTGVVASLEEHPLPQLVAAGVRCSISTDDPAMFDTDLTRDYEAAASLGLSPRAAYEAGRRRSALRRRHARAAPVDRRRVRLGSLDFRPHGYCERSGACRLHQ